MLLDGVLTFKSDFDCYRVVGLLVRLKGAILEVKALTYALFLVFLVRNRSFESCCCLGVFLKDEEEGDIWF